MDGFEIGGTELNAIRTLEALDRRDLGVEVLHLHAGGPLKSRLDATRHYTTYVPTSGLRSPRVAMTVAAIARTVRSRNISVLHAQDIYTNVLAGAAARLSGAKLITSRRWSQESPRRLLRPLNALFHRRSDLVLANSASLVACLTQEGVPSDRISIHGNFVDDYLIEPPDVQTIRSLRERLRISSTGLCIGCVARLSPVKRHDVLLEAFRIVLDTHPDATLVFVGDGECRRSLSEQAEVLGVSKNVLFSGTVVAPPLVQHAFDIVVLTSGSEGFPNSLIEGAACGKPLVSTMVGGVSDILVPGETGIAVNVGDVVSTAAALNVLLAGSDMRFKFGQAAREKCISSFGETAAIDRLTHIYRSMGGGFMRLGARQ